MKLSPGFLAVIAIVGLVYLARVEFRSLLHSVTTDSAPVCLEILGYTTTEEEGRTYIVGSFKNNCDRIFSHVTVLFKLDRKPGAFELPEGMAYAYGSDVKASETRQFKSALPISKDSSFRFDKISAY